MGQELAIHLKGDVLVSSAITIPLEELPKSSLIRMQVVLDLWPFEVMAVLKKRGLMTCLHRSSHAASWGHVLANAQYVSDKVHGEVGKLDPLNNGAICLTTVAKVVKLSLAHLTTTWLSDGSPSPSCGYKSRITSCHLNRWGWGEGNSLLWMNIEVNFSLTLKCIVLFLFYRWQSWGIERLMLPSKASHWYNWKENLGAL